jgi:hypothetical protein
LNLARTHTAATAAAFRCSFRSYCAVKLRIRKAAPQT